MPQIYYLPDQRLVTADDAETILETSVVSGIPHTHVCGGSARCSTCRVWIVEGLDCCAPRNDAEQSLAHRLGFEPRIRLACQTQIFGEGRITLRRLAFDAEDAETLDAQQSIHDVASPFGEEKQIAILFADLRQFTSFSELLPAYDVIYVLNRYYRRMGKIIEQCGGMVNNYMGDGLMALFGLDEPDGATHRAVQAAVEMQEAMSIFNSYLDSLYRRHLQVGIGIHFGQVVVGSVGSSSKDRRITAIGDAVNYASRIEAATKRVGAKILISEEAYTQIWQTVKVERQCKLDIPGKSGQYTLYEVGDIERQTRIIQNVDLSTHRSSPLLFRQRIHLFIRHLKAGLKRFLSRFL
ncbi:adenylate/guanylate cyclase domain-containing protein [Vacuolonema iberomarrocanum]|uniref:adenylate/guanylate cyclase domain-containing protein n=1 Tax=Vacuolonema iberomarrocanum TaxID=3454632 RepID=UPI0019DA5AB9|nr:adenylate/guanylate cyclase domain-containing protein [filamentous cyanobacterium LEGE 07170]